MAVRLHLNDGVELRVDVDLETMSGAYEKAVESNKLLEIQSADGTARRVNPGQILYFEEEAPDQEEGAAEQADPRAAVGL